MSNNLESRYPIQKAETDLQLKVIKLSPKNLNFTNLFEYTNYISIIYPKI